MEDYDPYLINPYEILGTKRSATAADIKKAYRKLVRSEHPDKLPQKLNRQPTDKENEEAKVKFDDIQHAWNLLRDDPYNAYGSERAIHLLQGKTNEHRIGEVERRNTKAIKGKKLIQTISAGDIYPIRDLTVNEIASALKKSGGKAYDALIYLNKTFPKERLMTEIITKPVKKPVVKHDDSYLDWMHPGRAEQRAEQRARAAPAPKEPSPEPAGSPKEPSPAPKEPAPEPAASPKEPSPSPKEPAPEPAASPKEPVQVRAQEPAPAPKPTPTPAPAVAGSAGSAGDPYAEMTALFATFGKSGLKSSKSKKKSGRRKISKKRHSKRRSKRSKKRKSKKRRSENRRRR
jgi:curved DNA-binding protein CbpA